MKNYSLFSALVATFLCFSFTSCEKPIDKNLPELKDLIIAPGTEVEVSFYAYDTWTIKTDKDWLAFNKNNGQAGDVKLVCSAADVFASAEDANVTLTIGTDIITFKVTRLEKVRNLTITNSEGSTVTSIVFTPETTSSIVTVKANFNWELDTKASTWPAWVVKPEIVTGTLNSQSGQYEGQITLSVDDVLIKGYYDSKEASITFVDINALDFNCTLPLSHTYVKPTPTDGISSVYGSVLTLGNDGKFKESRTSSIDFEVTPTEGETDFLAFIVMTDESAGTNTRTASAQYTQPYLTFAQKEGNVYTLTATKYPELYQNAGGVDCQPVDTKIFMLPSSIYGTWMKAGPINGQDPNLAYWWAFNADTLTKYDDNSVQPDYVKYAIIVNVEK